MKKTRAAITGVAGYVPEYILTNEELSTMVDTNDEWIMTRIGISERRILKDETKGTSFMAAKAVKELLKKTGNSPDDIEMLVWCGVTPDNATPATANIISNIVGTTKAFSFDMNAGCSSFLYGLQMVTQFIENGTCKKAILIGAEKMSSITNYTDRTTCPLFGDGAAAVLIEPNSDGYGIIDTILRADGAGSKHLYIAAGGSARPASMETLLRKEHYVYQDGPIVFKAAVSHMGDTTMELMERNNLTNDTLDWLVPHQANKRIIDATGKRIGLDGSKVMLNIQKYGNTSSATIPLCLWDYEKQLKKGDNLVITTFGAGFTWGAMYLKWAY